MELRQAPADRQAFRPRFPAGEYAASDMASMNQEALAIETAEIRLDLSAPDLDGLPPRTDPRSRRWVGY
jgi:hypothetical protein